MAIVKVGLYRKYHGKIPKDEHGQPLPRSEWPRKRAFRWVVRWFGSNGKRYSKSFKSRKEAERFADSKRPDVYKGKADPPPKVTFQDFYREHKELAKGNVARKTLHMQLVTMQYLAKHIGWSSRLTKIATQDIERFRSYRLQEGLAASSANRELRILKALFNQAIVRGYLETYQNPCALIRMIKVAPVRPNYCRPGEFVAIFSAAPDTFWRAFLVVAYTTGLRLQEILNLTWSDIDFEQTQLHVTRKVANGYVQPWQPKDHEMRTIPLAESAINVLAALQSVAPENCPYVFMEKGRWDFYREKFDARCWQPGQSLVNNMLRRFKTICRKVGIGPYSIHDLRRSCITNWAKVLPLHVVQKLAGHSSIQTTQTYYLSIQEEDMQRAQAVQEKLLEKIPASDLTDPLLTHFGQKRVFSGRKRFERGL